MNHLSTFACAILLAAFSLTTVQAQTGRDFRRVHINAGPEIGFPLRNFDDTNNLGLGGSAQLAIPFAFRFFMLGHVGYTYHFGAGSNPAVQLIPYRAGARMRVIGSTYVGAQAGATTRIIEGNRSGAFSYAAAVGFANHRIDFGARWERATFATNIDALVFRIAYVIGLQVGNASR